ncbi:hypothetical protein E3N88_05795 [Mikania micrantha]|uniref:DUF632 domain-containing protein n=1 Tax=Mikania micrantha TaxID=192012 RepID=A0A5N6PPW9_9ASTR|nr:hypothetical protein E3N88_05795 [Mikania micrantha]
MGCSSSKLDDEEAVQLCKDRKNFIKKAVEHRTRFASGHKAYLQSLKRVSAALKDYVEGDEPREFTLDPFTTPPLPSTKKTTPRFITISPNSFTIEPPKVNYLKSGSNPSVFVEQMPPESPETARVESYNQSPAYHYAADSFFSMHSPLQSQSQASIFNHNRPNLPPPSPQRSSHWDFFWNPFSSLDYYAYATRNSVFDDDINGLQQVREEEGIPELEEETEHEEAEQHSHRINRRSNDRVSCDHEDEVSVAADDDDDEFETDSGEETLSEHELESPPLMTRTQNLEGKPEGTPGFTVYVNRRPTSMSEVIKDIEAQFQIISDSANELSVMLDANRAQYSSSSSHELTGIKILNPVALLRSASSSRSNSSRFLVSSSLQRKKVMLAAVIYQMTRAGERIRIAYDKKCAQLRNHDAKGDDHASVHKTRTAIRDLHTQIKVSIHSVEAVSKRIETLRDQELQPQLLELIQGQDLLAGTLSKPKKYTPLHPTEPHRLAQSASNLESELQNWKSCFESWVTSQKSYIHAITGWLLRCIGSNSNNTTKLPFSPRRSAGAPPMFAVCIQWARLLDSQLKEGGGGSGVGSSRRFGGGSSGMEVVVSGRQEEETVEKMGEVAIRVLCAGMSVAVSSLTEFSLCSAQGYADLIKQWESATCPGSTGGVKV